MKATVLCFLALTAACVSAAPAQASVKLSADAKDIVDAAKPLLNQKKIAKMVRIIASQGENSRAFVASLADIDTGAQACLLAQSQGLEAKMKSGEIARGDVEATKNAILAGCPQYKTQLETTFNAYQKAMPEMNSVQGSFYSDFPQSVQTFLQNYAKLSADIQGKKVDPKDTATMGPRVKALVDEFKAISEADRQAVVAKLPYMKEVILPAGKYYADVNTMMDFLAAKAAGQNPDDSGIKAKGQQLVAYLGQHAEQFLNYFNQKIDDFKVPADIVKDGKVNQIAAKLGKNGASYAKLLMKQPQFNSALNAFVTGGIGGSSGSMSAAVMPANA